MSRAIGPRNLREFLELLRREGLLVEVEAEVDPDLELAEVHRRVIAANGPALLFRNVKGSHHAVAANLFGSARRVELALAPSPEKFLEQVVAFAQDLFPPTLGKLWGARGLAGRALRLGTRRVRQGPVTEVVESPPRLGELPVTRTWYEDGGPTMTLPLVYTEPLQPGPPNLGIYRMQRYSDDRTGMHWQIGKGGGFHHAAAEARGRPLPVTVFLGGPPAALVGALAPLPENVPELILASLLLGEKLPLVHRSDAPHPLLAEAEWCLVGEVPPGERHPEGPFGDHYGYYSLQHDYPVFHCQRVFRRRDAIYPATVVGKPRQEDFYLGDFLQELLSPLFPLAMPGVRDLWSYGETGYHSLAAAVVQERYRREAMASAFRILGEGQLSLTKFLLVLDRPQDLKDFRAVLEHVLARARMETDLFLFSNLSMDSLDYAGPRINEGSKGVLLGLGDPIRELPSAVPAGLPPEVREARVFCRGCLVVEGPAWEDERDAPGALARHESLADWPLVVLADNAAKAAVSPMNFLWTTFTRFDPAADLHSSSTEVAANHLQHRAPIVLDARMKHTYPDELFCDEATADQVDRRWKELFPSGVEMGDSGHANLDP